MNAPAFIADLQSRGAMLEVDGDRLRVTPATVLTDADRNAWREHKAAILELLETASRIAPATASPAADESTPELPRTFVALEVAPDVDSKTPAQWEVAAQALPTLRELFLREVAQQTRADGLVTVTARLATLWRCAEDECGHALTLSGCERVPSRFSDKGGLNGR